MSIPCLPLQPGNAAGISTDYRVAVVAERTLTSRNPTGVIYQDFGTDGGVQQLPPLTRHWNGTLTTEGSIGTCTIVAGQWDL